MLFSFYFSHTLLFYFWIFIVGIAFYPNNFHHFLLPSHSYYSFISFGVDFSFLFFFRLQLLSLSLQTLELWLLFNGFAACSRWLVYRIIRIVAVELCSVMWTNVNGFTKVNGCYVYNFFYFFFFIQLFCSACDTTVLAHIIFLSPFFFFFCLFYFILPTAQYKQAKNKTYIHDFWAHFS